MEFMRSIESLLYGRRTALSETHKENGTISEILAREIKRRDGMRPEQASSYLDWLKTKRSDGQDISEILNLEKLFGFKRSLDYSLSKNTDNPNMNDVLEGFDISKNQELVSTLLDYPQNFSFHAGLLFSNILYDSLSPELQRKLAPIKSKTRIRPKPYHKSWYLCDASEVFLDYSIKEKCVMTAGDGENNLFLMKFHGFLSGICLQNFVTSEGRVFVKGNWYLPAGSTTRDEIEENFKSGHGRIATQTGD